MTTLINADTVTGGAVITGDASGQLALQAAGVTQLTVSSSGVTIPTLIGANVNLTSNVTGTLPVLSGGTGATTLATNSVLLGNNGSPVQTVAPGASGNLLTSNGTTWASTAPAAAGGTITATSTGSITAGNAIQVNSNGTVSAPTLTYANTSGTVGSASSTATPGPGTLTYCPNVDKYLLTYPRSSDGYPVCIVGTPSASGAVTWGAETLLNSAASGYRQRAVYIPSQGVVVVCYNVTTTIQNMRAVLVNADGTVTLGTSVGAFPVGTLGAINSLGMAWSTTQEKLMTAGPNNNNGGYLGSSLFTVVGTTITNVSNVTNILSTYTSSDTYLFYDPVSDKFVIAGAYAGAFYGWIGTVSGTTTTWVNPQFITGTTPGNYPNAVYDSTSQKMVLSWFPNDGAVRTATLTLPGGTSFSMGAVVSFSTASSFLSSLTYDSGLNRIVYFYTNSANGYPTVVTGTVSGTSISIGSPTIIQSTYSAPSYWQLCGYSTAQKYTVCTWWISATQANYAAVTIGSSSLTANNFIGFSESTVSTGQPTIVTVSGGANNNQTGLTPALKYYVQPTGALSTSTSSLYGGISLSATKLLVKG